jgi:uncharacterized protein YbbC (DUF1343 family)
VSGLLALALAAAAAQVEVGLERIEAERGGALRGKRVGLIAHAASVTRDGRHALDVLRESGVTVVRVFAPEHGLRGTAAAGERVADGVDTRSGVPVVSLYGARTRPLPEHLRDIDALVVDLQDAGVRFYTYAATLLLALDAAAEAGRELVVLDRPNPLGGEIVEGPWSDLREAVPESLVNMTPGTLVHGLTLGELARHANAARAKPARLTVVELRGWRRTMTWTETGRAWIAPSPNLRSAEAALVYPGTALLEATSVSEGRGGDAPFLLVGAPFLRAEDARELAATLGAALAGAVFEPAEFTPRASPAAPHPKHAGTLCRGLRLSVTDARALSPYALGVRLLDALRRRPGFEWRDGGDALVRLMGSRRVLDALRRGDAPETILRDDEPGRERWRRERGPALLY